MIIFYVKPNILNLPYKVTRKIELRDKQNNPVFDENGKIRLVEKDFAEYHKFIPGKNCISKELWLKIVDYNKKNMEYYSTILKIFKPKIDEDTQEEIGENEDFINLKTLSVKEMKDLIENTMDIKDIDRYLKNEKERDRVRPSIIKAINNKKAQISEADEALSNKN
jgi:hypothetical protein